MPKITQKFVDKQQRERERRREREKTITTINQLNTTIWRFVHENMQSFAQVFFFLKKPEEPNSVQEWAFFAVFFSFCFVFHIAMQNTPLNK